MRIFLAGATGVIGVRLVPLLVSAGHTVAGMSRHASSTELLAELGAQPVIGDVYDRAFLVPAVADFAPDVLLHQLTDLPDDRREIPDYSQANARIRLEGTRNLLDAAAAARTKHFLAQSISWEPEGSGAITRSEFEAMVLTADGVVLRYGQFYGPGTYYPDTAPPAPRIHLDEAARRTVELLEAPSGVVTIVDDDPEGH